MFVFNSETSIKNALNSLLSQTFTNFELIISDNASTDSTPEICKEYLQKDKRIRFFQQKKNMGPWPNAMFVLEQAKFGYFMWAATDDIWQPTFIEKNIAVLESNHNVVGSTSDAIFFGRQIKRSDPNANNNLYKDFIKNMPSSSASYEEKAGYFLRNCLGMNMYSIFRTEKLRKCMVYQPHSYADLTVLLNVLKNGDLHVIDEALLHRSAKGITSHLNILSHRKQKVSLPWIIFPGIPVTCHLAHILGMKIFLKNLSYFLKLNYKSQRGFVLELLRLLKDKVLGTKKFS